MSEDFDFCPIGHIVSPYREKFGIPRQSGLVPAARGRLDLRAGISADATRGLGDFSHLWVTFVFHDVAEKETRELVRPPQLGGNRKVGVFASRSPFRPNRLGLSLVELLGIGEERGCVVLRLGGLDLLDGTPVFDVKPYLACIESVPGARGFAPSSPRKWIVEASPEVAGEFAGLPAPARALIAESLALDPRPAYHDDPERIYRCHLGGYRVRWRATAEKIIITALESEPCG